MGKVTITLEDTDEGMVSIVSEFDPPAKSGEPITSAAHQTAVIMLDTVVKVDQQHRLLEQAEADASPKH